MPDQATANAIAGARQSRINPRRRRRARGRQRGRHHAHRPNPAGYAGVAGDQAAKAVFAAAKSAIVGPIHSDFGWVVVKVDAVKAGGGKTLEQAKAEIAAKLNEDKRKGAIEELVDKVQKRSTAGATSPRPWPRPSCR